MKKVVITVLRGWIARNLLQNDFYKLLRAECRVVVLTPAANDPRFVQEFSHPNVKFVCIEEEPHNQWDRWLTFFHKNLIYNSTVNQKNHWGIISDPRSKRPFYFFYLFKKLLFTVLSKCHSLREIIRWLDFKFLQKKEVQKFIALLEEENPDLIYLTNVTSDAEAALVKAAQKKGIKTVASPKSWDNLSKIGLRAKADKLVVWNDFAMDEAIKFQNYKRSNISVIGIPQFDDYVKPEKLWSRKAFCEKYGLVPDKKIIFFGSEGKLHPADSDIASILYDFIAVKELAADCQLLIRPHFGYKNEINKFFALFNKPRVVIDSFNNPSKDFRDHWDYSVAFGERFINSIFHSAIIINTYSTLSLDGAAFGKPVICINFDGYKIKPFAEQTARWGEISYYSAIVKTGAVTVVNSAEELKNTINDYLKNPQLKSNEREGLVKDFAFKIDGQSGRRLFDIIRQELAMSHDLN